MRIQSLEITNIASLKGKHFIDFTEIYPFTNTFAITGETGAGKSSILNSISMALYSKNYNSNINQTDLVTLGETYGDIKLYFTVKNKTYLASWYCKLRKKNKELLKAAQFKKSLCLIDGDNEIELSKSSEDIIGLNFDQFCKTIILNQGQFSEFLLSSFTDRKKILETLYSQVDLSSLSRKNLKSITETKSKLASIDSKLDGLKVHEDIDIGGLIKEKNRFKTKTESLKEEKKAIKGLEKTSQEILKNIQALKDTRENIKKTKLDMDEATKKANKSKLLMLQNEELLTTIKKENKQEIPKLQKVIKTQEEINALNKRINERELEIKNLLGNKSEKEKELIILNEKLILAKELTETIVEKENFTLIDEDILSSIRKRLSQIQLNHQRTLTLKKEIEVLEQRKDEYKKNIQDIENKIKEIEFEASKQKLESTKKELSTIDNNIQKKNKEIAEIHSIKKDIVSKEQLLEEAAQSLHQVTNDLKLHRDEEKKLTKEINTITLALKSFELELMIQELSKTSLDKGHCLVCKNEDITAIKIKEPTSDQAELEKDQTSKMTQKDECTKKVSKLEVIKASLNEQLEKLKLELKELKQEVKEVSTSNTIENFIEEKKELEKNVTKLEIALRTQIDHEQKLTSENNSLDTLVSKIDSIKGKLDSEVTSMTKEKDSIKVELNKDSFTSSELEEWISQSIDYHKGNRDVQNLSTLIKRDNRAISEIQERIKDLANDNKASENQLQSLISSIEAKYKNKDLNHEIDAREIKQEKAQDVFENIQQQHNLDKIVVAENNSKLQMQNDQEKSYESNFITLKDKLSNSSENETLKALNKISSLKSINDVNVDIFVELIKFLNEHIEELTSKINEAMELNAKNELLIKQYEKTKTMIDEGMKERDHLQKHLDMLNDLHSVVGKDEFRNYVLSIIEKNLIAQTNHELKNLCGGRYKIFQKINSSSGQSEFYIEDIVNYAMDRKVSTLSGGETFMVSLSMALALAELTKGQTEIESFFIDEGFGTLDEESIEEVLEMINNLESQGKSIALISHIKELTSRIPVNLRVSKGTTGHSSISIVMS